jgi:undecaprenyl-diphosphatase
MMRGMLKDLQVTRWIAVHRHALIGGACALLLLSGFLELSEDVLGGRAEDATLARIDRTVLVAVASVRRSWLTAWALDATALGSSFVIVIFTAMLAWAFMHGGLRRSAGVLVAAAAGAGAWTVLLKRLFERPRPEVVPRLVEVSGLSYPSGHSLGSAAVYVSAALLLAGASRSALERTAIVLVAAALLVAIGASRVYLGVHYPTDVLAGLAFGTAWALLLLALSSFVSSRRSGDGEPRSLRG